MKKSTEAVLTWFRKLKNKKRKSLRVFDLCRFYASITTELMSKVLDLAETYGKIIEEKKDIIMKSKKLYLYTG